MKKYLLFSLIICLVLVFTLPQNVFGRATECTADEIRKISTEIRLLNLINGLGLDNEQMKFIIQKARQAEQLRAELIETGNGNQQAIEALQTFQELKDSLLKGENIPQDLKSQILKVERQIIETREAHDNSMSQLALEVKEILEPHQLYCLQTYKPCLIPPKEGAAGQADSSEVATRLLTRLRKAPQSVFEERKDKVAQQTVGHIKRHLPKGYILDEKAEEEWVVSVFEEARSMSEEDFAFKSADLADKFEARHALPKPPIDISVKVERFLLQPEIIPLLETKLATNSGIKTALNP